MTVELISVEMCIRDSHHTINPNHSTSFNPHSGDATKE